MVVKEKQVQAASNPRRLPMWVQTILRVFEGPAAKLGLVLLIIMLILCLGAPLFTHYSINDMDLLNGVFVFAINLMGDGLRDAMDPKLRK